MLLKLANELLPPLCFRLADLLIGQQRYNEATSEIRVLLSLSPKNRTVESLQKKLSQLKAAGGIVD